METSWKRADISGIWPILTCDSSAMLGSEPIHRSLYTLHAPEEKSSETICDKVEKRNGNIEMPGLGRKTSKTADFAFRRKVIFDIAHRTPRLTACPRHYPAREKQSFLTTVVLCHCDTITPKSIETIKTGRCAVPSAFIARSREWNQYQHMLVALVTISLSCHSCQFMSIHIFSVNSYNLVQFVSFMSIQVISCHSCQFNSSHS
jgi:hypothetical protein